MLGVVRSSTSAIARAYRGATAEAAQLYLTAGRMWRRHKFLWLGRPRRPITLFLAPEAGLAPYFASHALLARVMAVAGHPGVAPSCKGLRPAGPGNVAYPLNPTAP